MSVQPNSGNWRRIDEANDATLPPMDIPVWLVEGEGPLAIFIGGRASDGEGGWLWGRCYLMPWHDGRRWDGEIEQDDAYHPSHWMPLPEPQEPA